MLPSANLEGIVFQNFYPPKKKFFYPQTTFYS